MKQIKINSSATLLINFFLTFAVIFALISSTAHAFGPGATPRKKQTRAAYRAEIDAMISKNKVACKFSMDCEALPLGVKACGGPLEHLILSKGTHLKVSEGLDDLTKTINEMDTVANAESGAMGTCNVLEKPELECKAGACAKSAGK